MSILVHWSLLVAYPVLFHTSLGGVRELLGRICIHTGCSSCHPINGIRSLKYCCYDHRTFTATVVVGYHQTNTAIAVFYCVLGSISGRCFLTSAAQSTDSHLNAASFDCVNVPQVTPVSHTARLPPRVRFPTHCQDSSDSLGTVLSAPLPSRAVVLWAISAFQDSWNDLISKPWYPPFPINNPSLDIDGYSLRWRWHVKKHRHRPNCKFLPS